MKQWVERTNKHNTDCRREKMSLRKSHLAGTVTGWSEYMKDTSMNPCHCCLTFVVTTGTCSQSSRHVSICLLGVRA